MRVSTSTKASMLACGSCRPRIHTTSVRDGSTVSGQPPRPEEPEQPKMGLFQTPVSGFDQPPREFDADDKQPDRERDGGNDQPHDEAGEAASQLTTVVGVQLPDFEPQSVGDVADLRHSTGSKRRDHAVADPQPKIPFLCRPPVTSTFPLDSTLGVEEPQSVRGRWAAPGPGSAAPHWPRSVLQ